MFFLLNKKACSLEGNRSALGFARFGSWTGANRRGGAPARGAALQCTSPHARRSPGHAEAARSTQVPSRAFSLSLKGRRGRQVAGGSERVELAPDQVPPKPRRDESAASPRARRLPSGPGEALPDALRVSLAVFPGEKQKLVDTLSGARANFQLPARPAWGVHTLRGSLREARRAEGVKKGWDHPGQWVKSQGSRCPLPKLMC